MRRLWRLALSRPRAMLGVWLAGIALFGLAGLGLEDRLHRTTLQVSGTDSARAQELVRERFGDSQTLTVLLQGPPRAVRRQARSLAQRFERRPRVTVVGPWAPGSARILRPKPRQTILVVRVDDEYEPVSREVVPGLRADLEQAVRPPVEAHLTGYTDIGAGIHGGTVEALKRAELIAAPLLLLVLLAVFRSVVAAVLPLVMGLSTIGAARGVLDLVNRVSDLDAVALNLASMMGLALGVDYALLLVSRFREELAVADDPAAAIKVAVERTATTIAFAGLAIGGAIGTSLFIAPGDLLTSAGIGVLAAMAISVLTALTALPAALVLMGGSVNRLSFGRTSHRDSRWGGAAFRAVGRPALAGGLVLVLLLALSAPALGLSTGAPDPRVLPTSSVERRDFEAIRDALGPGWATPYEVVFVADRGRITNRARFDALARWQSRMAHADGVRAAIGPAVIERRTRPLRAAPRRLERAQRGLRRGERSLSRFSDGLDRADQGVGELQGGLDQAATGAGMLSAGAGRGDRGATMLRAGIDRAGRGAAMLEEGLDRAKPGATELVRGAATGTRGARKLSSGLAQARMGALGAVPRIRTLGDRLGQGARDLARLREPAQIADSELREARDALDRMLATSKADPQYARLFQSVARASGAVSGRNPLTGQPVQPGYRGLDTELAAGADQAQTAAAGVGRIADQTATLAAGLGRLERGARTLERGAGRLQTGTSRLRRGLERLRSGADPLADGLTRLQTGAASLATGIGELRSGAGELERGLDQGAGRTSDLRGGVRRLEDGAVRFRGQLSKLKRDPSETRQLTNALGSGYAVLAAIDRSSPTLRSASTFTVNVDEGGSAARMVFIPEGNSTRAGHPLRSELEDGAADLGRQANLASGVGGPAALLQDFDSETSERLPLLVLALAFVTFLILIPLLRSLLLPLLAVILNVITVAAAFGILALAFQGSAPLGGPGFLDAIMILSIFSIVFGLSIDYEVFLLARMREGWLLHGTTDEAISHGLRKTAGVITGAALIMTAVFVAFALADITTMRQLGVGLTVAVLLDATLIRLILLPAAIRLAGDAAWWLPRWLERLLPAQPETTSAHTSTGATPP